MWSYYGIKYKVLISIIKIFAGALRATRIELPEAVVELRHRRITPSAALA